MILKSEIKRLIISSVIVVLSAMSHMATAQRYYTPHFDIGGKAGITMSNMQFSPSVEQAMLMGEMAGITMRYTEEKIFGLIAELNIEQRGWKEGFEKDEGDFDYRRHFTYVQLPLLTHIYFGGKKFKGFVNLGPSVGYMIGDKITSNFDYENPGSVSGFPMQYRSVEQMRMDVSNKFDYGIMAGAGMELIMKRKHSFLLEFRYYFGLGNVFPSSRKDVFSASRGTSIQVSLGYMIRVK